jgi:signal transduction histidine kinase
VRVHGSSRLRAWTRSAATLTASVVVIGLAVSLATGAVLLQVSRESAAEAMTARTSLVAQSVSTEVGRYIDQLATLAASLGSIDRLTAAQFVEATSSLTRVGLPGATSVAYIVPSDDTQTAAIQADWRARGVAGLMLVPKGHGMHLFNVLSIALDQGAHATRGLDVSQAAEIRQALSEAQGRGRVTVSDTHHLLIDKALPAAQRQNSFVLTAPIDGTGASGRPVFRGWLVLGLRGQDFMDAVLDRAAQNFVDVNLSARNADGALVQVAMQRARASGDRNLHRTQIVDVAQRKWVLRTDARSTVLPGGSIRSAAAISSALLALTALLAALVQTLATSRARAQKTVDTATVELRQAVAESRDQAQLLGTILDTLTEGVGVVDQQGAFLLHNKAARRWLGVKVDADEPHAWQGHYGMFQPDGQTPFPEEEIPLLLALKGESPTGVELVIRNPSQPDGVLLSVSARQLELGGEPNGAVAVFHDVTAARAHEAELTGFAGVVAHDLKSPLTGVVGYAEMLEDILIEHLGGPIREEALSSLRRIQATAFRMRTLIDGLLSYTTARDANLNAVVFDLATVAHDVVNLRVDAIRADRDGGQTPDVYVGPLPAVYADPLLVRQLMDNLIGNALKYASHGRPAHVDITGRFDRLRGGEVPAVRVEIADRGIGVPAGEHGKIFARFHRAHPDAGYTGTGLGLAICHRIVERHGGSIGVADNPGGGACFWVTLPAASADRETARVAGERESELSGGRSAGIVRPGGG